MFNRDLKERFMNEQGFDISTRKLYSYVFSKASDRIEEKIQKDIYQLTPSECDNLLFSFPNKSEQMVSVMVSCLKNYVNFCIKHNYIEDTFNYFATINGAEGMRNYVNRIVNEKKYMSFEEMMEASNTLINAQDFAIIVLLFSGVKGEKASELLNLKSSDIKEDRIILPSREIQIDPFVYLAIEDAIKQTEYDIANGESTNDKYKSRVLMPSEYVLKPSGSKKSGKLNYSALNMRVYAIQKYMGNPNMNITNIWLSGMLHQLKMIKAEKGELTVNDYNKVHEIFGYNPGHYSLTKIRFEQFL